MHLYDLPSSPSATTVGSPTSLLLDLSIDVQSGFRTKLSLKDLPEEVLVIMLGCGLEPEDVMSFGLTCRRLRAVSFARIVWTRLWKEESRTNALPRRLPYKLLTSDEDPPPEVIGSVDVKRPLHPAPESLSYGTPGKELPCRHPWYRYLVSRRVRRNAARDRPIVRPKPLPSLLRAIPIEEILSTTMTSDGDFLLVWHRAGILLLDLHRAYEINIPIVREVPASSFNGIAADVFNVGERTGLLMVGSFYDPTINFLFLPLKSLRPEVEVSKVPFERLRPSFLDISSRYVYWLTGGHLVVGHMALPMQPRSTAKYDAVGIIDLMAGTTYHLAHDSPHPRSARVYGRDLVIANDNGSVRHISLPQLRLINTSDPHHPDRALPRRSFEMYDYSSNMIGLPSSIPRDGSAEEAVNQFVSIWHVGWAQINTEGLPLSTVGLTKSSLDPAQPWSVKPIARPLTSNLMPLPAPKPTPASASDVRNPSASSSTSSSRPSRPVLPESRYSSAEALRHSIDARVAAYYSQAGVDRVLSLVTNNNAAYDGLVLTESSPWAGVQHKPIYVRKEAGDGEGNDTVERLRFAKARKDADTTVFWWSELSGKIVVRTRDDTKKTFDYFMYEFV